MKLLVDENLSPRLAAWLRREGLEGLHVREVSLQRTLDTVIRNTMGATGWIIVTKDDDFVRMQRPTDGPVLHLICGNLRRAELVRRFAACWPELREWL